MAYYRLSQVLKMRREAMEHSRFDYDVEGPSFMTVYRLETGKVRIKEKTYRSLSRAMGEEESTRRGVLKTKDLWVLHMVNDISNSLLQMDYQKTEGLIEQLEKKLDYTVKRNQRYLDYEKAKLKYNLGQISGEDYENILRTNFTYGKMDFDKMLEKGWPFRERELQMLVSIIGLVRAKKDNEQQAYIAKKISQCLQQKYLESEYEVIYDSWIRWGIGDMLGTVGCHRKAIEIDEDNLKMCEEKGETRYLAEIYYDIFWNYYMLRKKETLTEQEEDRCKECLLKAYYINKAWHRPKKLYEKRMKECYPDELR